MSASLSNLAVEFGGFLVVGALTTALDLVVYNLLTRRPPGWGRIPANVISCTVAMSFSFTVNGHCVFRPEITGWTGQAVKFVLVTAISSYGLQSLVIHALSRWWLMPVRLVEGLVRRGSWSNGCGKDVVARNTVKAAAVGVGLLWNFAWYHGWVFA